MALNSNNQPVQTTGGLKLKNRKTTQNKKKVLIYGNDGSGKSTFAEQYCKDNNLKAVVVDIDDTNYTDMDIVEVDLSSDLKAYKFMKNIIALVDKDPNYDTIIIDGVTSYLEMLVSKANGLKKYSDRAERFNDVLRDLLHTNLNLIFIGQADMKVIYSEDHQSNKSIIKINSLVNEKYHTYITKNGNKTEYKFETEKYRGADAP